MEQYLAEIRMFAGNFPPKGWAFCNGQILSIAQNTALFALLGTTYGGNGQTTFALPNLQGRVPLCAGQGPGLSPHTWGEMGGTATHTLLSQEMPYHSHSGVVTVTKAELKANGGSATSSDPTSQLPATAQKGLLYNSIPTDTMASGAMQANGPVTLGIAGGSQPHTNLQPSLSINFIIAIQGIYPSRDF